MAALVDHGALVDSAVRYIGPALINRNDSSQNFNVWDLYGGYFDRMNEVAASNSAASAAQAAELRSWQERQNRIAMDFNAQEAAKNRDWQEMMSNTAHQREVADLVAAGLNPILSAMGGNGAAVTSGATASGVTSSGAKGEVDTSANVSIASLLGNMLQAQTSMLNTVTNAQNNMAIAEKTNAMNRLITEMNNSNSYRMAEMARDLGMFQSLNSLAGTQFSANRAYEATALAALYSLFGTEYMADMNYRIQQDFPNTWPAIIERFLEGLGFGPNDAGNFAKDWLKLNSETVRDVANTVVNAASSIPGYPVTSVLGLFGRIPGTTITNPEAGFSGQDGKFRTKSGYHGVGMNSGEKYSRDFWNMVRRARFRNAF